MKRKVNEHPVVISGYFDLHVALLFYTALLVKEKVSKKLKQACCSVDQLKQIFGSSNSLKIKS